MPKSPSFSDRLIKWYHQKKRDLPWRHTNDPYVIWLSEIILQQTRVDQGISYFDKFVSKYPNVHAMASASEQEILRLWQGLGYYSRARNMHQTAQYIVNELNGIFPNTYDDIVKLKGVGPYTAAAIASFSFKLPYPVMDGNVIRVISRYFGIRQASDLNETRKLLESKLDSIFDKNDPDTFNQAVMEFGALYCTPSRPDCSNCIYNGDCLAYDMDLVDVIPVKSKKVKKKERYFHYFILRDEDRLVLNKRQNQDIWKNLFDFPSTESSEKNDESSIQDLLKGKYAGVPVKFLHESSWKKHLLTHQTIHAKFWEYQIDLTQLNSNESWEIIERQKSSEYPMPKLIESYLHAG